MKALNEMKYPQRIQHEIKKREIEIGDQLDLQWFTQPADLLSAVQGLGIPAVEGFAWCAGEATLMSKLKDILEASKALPVECMKVGSYWKSGDPGYHANLVRPQE